MTPQQRTTLADDLVMVARSAMDRHFVAGLNAGVTDESAVGAELVRRLLFALKGSDHAALCPALIAEATRYLEARGGL